jgi:hypothetical protein
MFKNLHRSASIQFVENLILELRLDEGAKSTEMSYLILLDIA